MKKGIIIFLISSLLGAGLALVIDYVRNGNFAFADLTPNLILATPNPLPNESALVGYWTFNGKDTILNSTTTDMSGNGNDGTLGTTASTTADTSDPTPTGGVIGQALSFDGVDDYVSVADSSSLDITSAITLEAWVFDPPLGEIINLRQENSKTFNLGNGQRKLEASMGAIHYKDNYANASEQWKDIDLTWVGNQITKAPYELTLDGKKITVRDKKTGDISTIELLDVTPAGFPFKIVPENSAVRFRHTLPSDKVPFEASFRVTGKIPLSTHAFDDGGGLELGTTLVGDILTEKFSQV
ncbi:MAG: hypothetical protein Q7J30_00870, partial [Candidatus Azambacteria bacterium]|nr:hypothetical protein [Candidatus Azambacteria bacterium]